MAQGSTDQSVTVSNPADSQDKRALQLLEDIKIEMKKHTRILAAMLDFLDDAGSGDLDIETDELDDAGDE